MATDVLTRGDPEDAAFWESEGRAVATRNLSISIPSLTLAFAVWMMWSVVVVNLPNVGFKFSTTELFLLAALPGLCGATLRIPYWFMVPALGSRRWTAISTALLLLPTIGIGIALQDPTTGYSTFVILALLSGFGGGNFTSSISNANFFPKVQKGMALGLSAGLGNLGVSLVQFVVPLVITAGLFGALGGESQAWTKGAEVKQLWLQNAGLIWVPFIAICAVSAWFGMSDFATARASFSAPATIFRRKHNWIMCWLYLGTFGSFIGYSAGFPLLIHSQFPHINALSYAWLGPLVTVLVRPLGGWLSDNLGAAPVTFWNFIAMAAGMAGVLSSLPQAGQGGDFYGFLAMFMVLFMTAGIGDGSTFRMILNISLVEREHEAEGKGKAAAEQAVRDADTDAAAALGFASAVGAYGGFFVPMGYGVSISMTGGAEAALYVLMLFYLTCIALTWWYYWRSNAPTPC